ncbi:Leucine-, isoleucine-, valine-, threonine-, and alanine-binding protein [Burkholderiales bacterium]|nr:Leucine-, isoleucine-, valine-, threonine-, and alanine-binding protein [Burkholderiales bacterium]
MSTDLFNVVLVGTTLRGLDVSEVAPELAKLTKRDPAFARSLLSGRPTKIKTGVNASTGARYLEALERIGVAARLDPETLEVDADLGVKQRQAHGARQDTSSSHSTVPLATSEPPLPSNTAPTQADYYRAAIGPRNQAYYLKYFTQADAAWSFRISWNWPAFFVSFPWLIYRKLWKLAALYAVAPFALAFCTGLVVSHIIASQTGGAIPEPKDVVRAMGTVVLVSSAVGFVAWFLILPAYVNGLYHRHIRRKVYVAQHAFSEPEERIEWLSRHGGTSSILAVTSIWVATFFTGLVAAVALSAYQDYQLEGSQSALGGIGESRSAVSRSRAVTAPTTSSGSSEAAGQPIAGVGAGATNRHIVKIGYAGPLTGRSTKAGLDALHGVRMALDEANAKGYTIGGRRIWFALQSEDDQFDPSIALQASQRLLDAGVVAVVGHLSSGTTIPPSVIYQQAGIPVISGSATHPKVTEQGFATTFRTIGRDDLQAPAIARFFVEDVKARKIAIVDDSSKYGEDLAMAVEKAYRGLGGEVVARIKASSSDMQVESVIRKLVQGRPDAVFFGGMDETAAHLLKRVRQLGYVWPFAFGDGACAADAMTQIVGLEFAGAYCSQTGTPPQFATKSFLGAFGARYGAPGAYAPYYYDAATAIVVAMHKADSVDPVAFLPVLGTVSFDGATGRVAFDPKGDRKNSNTTIFRILSSGFVPVRVVAAP